MYAYDIMHGENWGDGPVKESGYDYLSPLAALDAALDVIDAEGWRDDGISTGVYVSGERDENDRGPQWEWSPQVHAYGGPVLSAMEEAEDIYA